MQRLPGSAAGGQFVQPGGLGGGGAVIKAGVPARHKTVEFPGVKVRVGTACLPQRVFPAAYHRPSSAFSGSTGVTAAMATSIMESSGSKVVSRCSHSPGVAMALASAPWERPDHLRIS